MSKKYYLIIIIWLLGLFIRCYRQSSLLGFYYDQGRDAQMAADIISGRNFPAIGPTTGIDGLYLGPFWYYLITPGYWLGNGDPAIASYFICFLESLTIPLIYLLLSRYWNRTSALVGATIWTFSRYLVSSSRWFSNPSPVPLFSLLIIFLLLQIFHHRQPKYWPIVFILLGLSLQLEAASAVFFIPTIIIFSLLNYRQLRLVKIKTWLLSLFAFFLLLVPQVAFELKNNFLISRNFLGFISGRLNSNSGQSWAIPGIIFVQKRLLSYYQAFFSKLDTNLTYISLFFFAVLIFGLIILILKHRSSEFIQITLLWLFIPLIMLLFFVGNYGNLYDYYLTGFFPAFVLLFAISVSLFPFSKLVPLFSILVLLLFLNANSIHLYNYITAGADGPTHISLGNEKQAVGYICQQAANNSYNLDIYVPPVIPHAYDYLFSWYQRRFHCPLQSTTLTKTLYLLYEVDPPHPERLEKWLQRQNSIAKVINQVRFGGIVIEQRERLNYE